MVGVAEVESATFCVSCKRSNQLSYTPEKEVRMSFFFFPADGKLFFIFFLQKAKSFARPCGIRHGKSPSGECGVPRTAVDFQNLVAGGFAADNGNAAFRQRERSREKRRELLIRPPALGNGLYLYFHGTAERSRELRFLRVRNRADVQQKKIRRARRRPPISPLPHGL